MDKLNVYKKYSGNIESWDRFGKEKDKGLLDYQEWELIDELIQNLELVDKGLASEGFASRTLARLSEACDNLKTQGEVKALVGKY